MSGIAGDGADGEVVVLDRREVDVGERLQDLRGLRPLQREQRDVVAHVLDARLEPVEVLADVREVLRGVRRVHDHHEVVGEAVDEAVVLERAAVVEDRRVVRLADGERGDVVRRHVVHELHGVGAA